MLVKSVAISLSTICLNIFSIIQLLSVSVSVMIPYHLLSPKHGDFTAFEVIFSIGYLFSWYPFLMTSKDELEL